MGLFRTTLHWPPPAPETPLEKLTWCVIDTETSGLDTRRDRVLSLGAFDVSMAGIVLNRRFEAVLKIDIPLNEHNILIHRLTPQQLTLGRELRETYSRFLRHIRDKPLLAFHAAFDKAMLERELRINLNLTCRLPFSDVAFWLRALFPEQRQFRTLDDWMAHFRLEMPNRHQAAIDALCTAELALIALHQAQRQGLQTLKQLDETVRTSAALHALSH
ncbi:MAG: 3'-5' exonuclease [Hahellaceae bacterium]|nr:3'-5' exonuclease [Hahellaceae bacterium]